MRKETETMAEEPIKLQAQTSPGEGAPKSTNGAAPNGNGQAAVERDGNAPGSGAEEKKPSMSPSKKLLFGIIGAAVVLIVALWGVRYLKYSRTHAGTDDAYITGNLVNVSPIVSGTLSQLTVDDGAVVKKGQLIARLEDSGQQAALRQAQAAYAAALSQIPQARLNLAYQQQATAAAIQKAQAGIASQRAKTAGAGAQVTLATNTTVNQVRQAQSQVQAAQAQAAQAQAQVRTAQAAASGYRQAVQTAQRAAAAAAARIQASQANRDKFVRDEARYRRLLAQDAITQQQYDVVAANLQGAEAQLAVDREQAAQAQSAVEQAREGVLQAMAQLGATEKAAAAAREQVSVARAGLGLARANSTQVGVQQSNLLNNIGQGSQADADLATAEAGRQQIGLRQKQIATAEAQAQQAKAALANAQVAENNTYIYAPSDGTVVKKTANVGNSLSIGQTILTMTQGDTVWVSANFKETQLNNVRVGLPVEVEADTFPGKVFHGRVQSINEATGAATSLLPPDNATGNFTKVVQRIPVKMLLMPASDNEDKKYGRAEDIRRLRQGMSVVATIDTGAKPEPVRSMGTASSGAGR